MKYELTRKGNVVLGRVLDQEKNTRAKYESDAITTACRQDESEQNQYNGFDDYCIIGG